MRFSIAEIQYEIGENEIDLIRDFPEHEAVLQKTGMPRLYRSDRSVEILATAAAEKLLSLHHEYRSEVGCLIVVSQSSDYHLPSIACSVHQNLGLSPSAMSFDINQGCSGFVQALCVAVSLLESHPCILIVTADKYREKLRAGDRSTESVFSDAAAATLIRRGGLLSITYQSHLTDGSGRRFLVQRIGDSLSMSGADVFVWTRSKVLRQIQSAIASESSIARRPQSIYLHQASQLVIDSIRAQLPTDIVVPIDVSRYGNTVSSSIPILLSNELAGFKQNRCSLLAGFGVGLSSSVVSISRSIDETQST